MKNKKQENGQILVIMVLAVVVIFGFTALAIDGSMIYSERRSDKAAADSAALAGAGAAAQYLKVNLAGSFSCTNSIVTTAMQRAATDAASAALVDGITLTTDPTTGNYVSTTCNSTGRYIDVQVITSSEVETTFLQVISKEPLNTKTETVARVYVSSTFAGGNTLVALGETCGPNGGIWASGNTRALVSGGGVYSASCISAVGSSQILTDNFPIEYKGVGTSSFDTGTTIQTTTGNGIFLQYQNYINTIPGLDLTGISYSLDYKMDPNPLLADAKYWPNPTTRTMSGLDVPKMEVTNPPTCIAGSPTIHPSDSGQTIQPGTYSSLTWDSNGAGNLVFAPGTYCFTGPVEIDTGGAAWVIMDNTTLYFASGAGGLNTGGNLKYSMNNSTLYITNGTIDIGRQFDASNSKIYIASGLFTTTGVADVTMDNSSIYINNGDFDLTNGYFDAYNFTIYIKQGDFILENGCYGVNMTAPTCSDSTCGVGPAIPGILLYMDETNTGVFEIANGNGPHHLDGTMYCPNALAYISGGTDTSTVDVQLIAKRISLEDGGKISMNTGDSSLFSQGSTTIEMYK